ncbi:hypothetical protein Smic_79080 [Streptomyces microflavus]|uniref:Uncharacterized protein n=1 Tax=Streptomyces microflavus TaxID=1919 RepID=A0A7J0D3R3_STRMI|nr:hypothetical protein Smic_79080 [Streptomyces microflavus]
MQITWEADSRRSKNQDAWAKDIFPAVCERLKQAAAAMPSGTPSQPFVDALTELVQAQAGTTGFVVLNRWGRSWNATSRPDCPTPTTPPRSRAPARPIGQRRGGATVAVIAGRTYLITCPGRNWNACSLGRCPRRPCNEAGSVLEQPQTNAFHTKDGVGTL